MRKTITNEEIIITLLSSESIRAAAKSLNIQEKTLYHRIKDDKFKTEYRQARAELVKTASAKLQSRLSTAIDVITEIMTDESAPPQVRLNAAELIVKRSLSLFETVDIIERIEALEAISGGV